MRHVLSLPSLVLACVLVACGGGADGAGEAAPPLVEEPEEVARRFLRVVQAGDEEGLAGLVTEEALAALRSGEGFDVEGSELESFEVGKASYANCRAAVPVDWVESGEERASELLFRQEERAWRLYGMRLDFGDGSLTLDFEEAAQAADALGEALAEEIGRGMEEAFAEAQRTWEQGGTPEENAARRAAFEAVEAVGPDEHGAAWRVDVDAAGRPAEDVLAELVGPCGLALDAGGHAALADPIDLRLDGVSRVEAVERVAAQAGLHPVWPAPRPAPGFEREEAQPAPLSFADGPRLRLASFAGPFLVEVVALDEEPPNAVGSLSLAVRALGLAPAVLAFQDESAEILRVERVRGPDDAPLADESTRYLSTPEVRDGYFVHTLDLELTGLLRGVGSIEEVAGEVRLPLPVEVEQVAWEQGDDGARELAAGTLSVQSWGASTQFALESEAGGLDAVQVRLAPRKASGEPLGVRFASSGGWGRSLTASVQCPEPPAAVDLKVCSVETLRVPFELGPVPLARSAEQPERLAELAYEGDAPVVADAFDLRGGGDQREVTLRVQNAANKDVVSLTVDLVYLDAGGAELDDFPSTLTGGYDFETERFGPFVAAGETEERTTTAPFVPEGTKAVRVRPRSVEFPDGTSWEAQER